MKLTFLLSAVLAACVFPAAAEEKKPNIVYILVDDLGYADCGFNGGKEIKTPNIDALANSGAVLKSYYVQPLCSATRASFLSGKFPVQHGLYGALKPDITEGLPLAEKTLAQALKEKGYTTAITGKWHLGESKPEYLPTRRGFDHQYGLWYGAMDYFTHVRAGRVDWYRDDKRIEEEGYSTHLIANEAVRLIGKQPEDKPLFLYVPFNAVHGPYQVPDSYKTPYADLPPQRRTLAAMLSVVDESVGKIVKALEDKKMKEDTLIIFSSDNGGVGPGKITKNTPLRAGKGTLYEGGVRVAAFATWPGKIPAGKSISVPIHIVDWYPTLTSLTGATAQPKLDGVDILPLLTKGEAPSRDALLLTGTGPKKAALRMGDWKLIQSQGQGEPTFELYHLKDDLSETKDLSKDEPERLRQMQERLRELAANPTKPITGRSKQRRK